MPSYIKDTGDLKRLNRQLGKVADGKALRKELSGGFRKALKPVVPKLRAAYLANPGHTGQRSRTRAGQPNLRTLLAKSVRLEIRGSGRFAGARIRADGRKMPDGMKALPKYYEGEIARWRAPVYGNRSAWAQYRARPTFFRTVEPEEPAVSKAIGAVLDRVRDKLEKGDP